MLDCAVCLKPYIRSYKWTLSTWQYFIQHCTCYINITLFSDPNQGRHAIPELFWPEYDLTSRDELLETATPIIQSHTQEVQDHFNWFMYDFPAMMIPPDGEPGDVKWQPTMFAETMKGNGKDDYNDYDY